MNLHTFKDLVNAKKSSLVNDLDEGDEEKEVGVLRKPVDGEEEEGDDKKEKGEIDAWLADMDEAAMEQGIGEAAKALKLRQEKISQAEAAASATVKKSKLELKVLLLEIMRPGENVVQTMRRLSGKMPSAGKTKKRTPRSQNGEAVTALATETPDQKLANKVALERFSDITDELLSTGLSGVYDMTYEAIENSAVQWEYRGLDGVIHGPFAPETIAGWKAQGYFTGSSAVMMRKVGVVGKEWGPDASTSNSSTGASSSSATVTAAESVIGKVRFNLDPDKSSEPAAKKAKTAIEKADGSSAQDLMNDLEDDDDEVEESVKGTPVPVAVPVPVPDVMDQQRGEWISSDDVDFETSVEIEEKKEGVEEEDVDDDEDAIR